MGGNKNTELNDAKKEKKDEFYTERETVETELNHYREHFKGKTVFCNCDDPKTSEFYRYFWTRFKTLGLKKLISTHFIRNPSSDMDAPFDPIDDCDGKYRSYKLEVTEDCLTTDKNGFYRGKKTKLQCNGDFRSRECVDLMKEADIIVTNPPFSKFREMVALLTKHKKKFLLIGNINSLTSKEVFPLIKDNKMWYGYTMRNVKTFFQAGKDYPLDDCKCYFYDDDGKLHIGVKGVMWFTNMTYNGMWDEPIELTERYTAKKYPKFDGTNIIYVDKTKNIPYDYNGPMAVPVSFYLHYNPKQFDIIGTAGSTSSGYNLSNTKINGKSEYKRIIVVKKD